MKVSSAYQIETPSPWDAQLAYEIIEPTVTCKRQKMLMISSGSQTFIFLSMEEPNCHKGQLYYTQSIKTKYAKTISEHPDKDYLIAVPDVHMIEKRAPNFHGRLVSPSVTNHHFAF